jgi:hypothetical protein
MAMAALKNQYLGEMGIDVWVLRSKSTGRTVVPSTSPAMPEQQSEATDEATDHAQKIPNFHLCFMTSPAVSLVFSIPADAETVPARLHRFAADVLLALSGDSKASIGTVHWPMVQSQHIDQTEHAARAVLRRRLEHCAPLVMVFGVEAQRWIDDVSPRRSVALSDMGTYLAEPSTKRDLWQSVMAVKAELTA